MGKLSTLLAWHRQFPPTEAERKRNETIYSTYQRNRNPFIDNPLFVDQVFTGDTPGGAWKRAAFTAAQLANSTVSGDTADPDGDGLPNRLEFLYNLRALVSDRSESTDLGVEVLPPLTEGGASRLALSYRKHRYATDLTIFPEASDDLVTWSGFTPTATSVAYVDALTDRVTIQTPMTGERRFVRLRVERAGQ